MPLKKPRASVHLVKNSRMSVAKSLITGKLFKGAISRLSPSTIFATWVRQVQRALPLTVMAHEPHIPTRQAKR